MPFYVRAYVFGGSYSFTVTLLERCRRWLTENVEGLHEAFRLVRNQRPFHIDGVVIVPDHLEHAIGIKGTMTRISTTVFNPVKHSWVPRVADWPHSRFHRFVRLGLSPLE